MPKEIEEEFSEKDYSRGFIERLSIYLTCLVEFREEGYEDITSQELGECVGINPAELRRDLGKFGAFGKKGVGYNIDVLISAIERILGAKKEHKMVLVGAGNLGSALVGYEGLKRHGFNIVAVFDRDARKVGKKIGGIEVQHTNELKRVIKKKKIEVGIIAVPEEFAQVVADSLVGAGIKVIVNYAPIHITVPREVKVHNTNPAVELLHTLYFLSRTPSTL